MKAPSVLNTFLYLITLSLLIDENTESQKLSKWPRVSRLINHRVRICREACLTPKHQIASPIPKQKETVLRNFTLLGEGCDQVPTAPTQVHN